MCQLFIKKVKKQEAREFVGISWNSNLKSPCEINRHLRWWTKLCQTTKHVKGIHFASENVCFWAGQIIRSMWQCYSLLFGTELWIPFYSHYQCTVVAAHFVLRWKRAGEGGKWERFKSDIVLRKKIWAWAFLHWHRPSYPNYLLQST